MSVTQQDLTPGAVIATTGGTAITPQALRVRVSWVDDGGVHYRHMDGDRAVGPVRQTPVSRFLDIANGCNGPARDGR